MTESTRQAWPPHAWLLHIDDLRIDMRFRRVIRPDQTVELPQRAFDLLLLLLREPHVLHTRADLFQRVWPGVIVEDANLSQSIWLLRKALGPGRKDWIRTVAKGGYVFEPPGPVAVVDEPPAPGLASAPAERDDPSPDAAARSTPAPGKTEATTPTVSPAREANEANLALPMPPRPAPAPSRRRWWLATALSLLALAAAANWFGGHPLRRPPAHLNILLIEVQSAAPASEDSRWHTALLHAWLDWKLRTLPNVNVLREENLAAEASPAQPRVVLLATGVSPQSPGQVYVRASFDGATGGQSVQQVGPAAALPDLVDSVSQQVVQRLMPSRMQDAWPPLSLDLETSRRFVETFRALERRDWRAAQVAADAVVQRAPTFGPARVQLAIALGRLGQASLAVEQFATARTTLKPLPDDAGRVVDALQLAADPRRLAEAAEAFGALARDYPERSGFLLDQGHLYSRLGLLDQARDTLTDPSWRTQAIGMRIPQLLALANVYLQLGDPAQARVHAALAHKLATAAGEGWRIEQAIATVIRAQADVDQYQDKAELAPFEQAARQFEAAGDEIDALYARFLAESARGPGSAAGLDALLQKARAGGFRRLEIDILRRVAFQYYIAGNMPQYRARLPQALSVANEAGDPIAQQHLDLDLLNEDMATGDFASAEQRLQRLRRSTLRGERAFWVAQFGAQLEFLRGRYDRAMAQLDQAVADARAAGGTPPPIAAARLACAQGDVLVAQGHVDSARSRYAACGNVDHAMTRLQADLGQVLLEASTHPAGANVEAQRALLARIEALPDGPDRWWPAVALASALTRSGDPARAEATYREVSLNAARANYRLLAQIVDVGLAEVAAAQGDWASSQRHASAARATLASEDWFLQSRVAELDIGQSLAQGNTEAALGKLARLDAQAHRIGDAIVLQEVHSLLPPSAVIEGCTADTRARLARQTRMHGVTLAWMVPRADRAGGMLKATGTRSAR